MIEKKILKKFIKQGLNIIPVSEEKIPVIKGWKKYQEEMVNLDEMPDYKAVAVITGKVSGNLEVIDIDQKYCLEGTLRDRYKALVDDFAPDLWDKLVECTTKGGGFHLVYRCEEIGTNVKLASRPATPEELEEKKEKFKVLIETRAEGGYFLCKPTVGYDVKKNVLLDPPTISKEERDVLMSAARALDETPLPLWESQSKPQFNSEGIPSWESYDDDDHWLSVMQSDGWTVFKETDTKIFLKRPGADSKYSGNFDKRHRLMRIFSSSTEFDNTRSYSPSGIFTVLRCGGDFKQGARQLFEMGYGKAAEKKHKRVDEEIELKSDDDSSEYLYDESEDENIFLFSEGKLPLGYETGYTELDEYIRIKPGKFNCWAGHMNLGKSYITWNIYFSFCLKHKKKFIFFSRENKAWTIRKSLIEFIYGRNITRLSRLQIQKGLEIVKKHVTFVEYKGYPSYHWILEKSEAILKKEEHFGLLIDPYSSLSYDFTKSDRKLSTFEYHNEAATVFKHWADVNDCHLALILHGVTEAQRKTHTEADMKGLMKPIIAADVEFGAMWSNRCDDFIVVHRYANHAEWKNQTHIHVLKLKEEWSGGKRTMRDEPVILTLNNGGRDFFGFWCKNDSNPFYNYAKKLNIVQTNEKPTIDTSSVYEEPEENNDIQDEIDYARGNTFRNVRPEVDNNEEEEDKPPF